MKLIFRYMGRYRAAVLLAMGIKLAGTMTELLLPYILEYMIDDVVPAGSLPRVVLWGLLMFAAAVVCRQLNVLANRRTVDNAHRISYDVQSAVQQLQAMCVRAPMLLLGGMVMTLAMDLPLAMILVVMLPVLLAVVFFVCAKGIPMYNTVQKRLDSVVRIMRENITGIRVVKALSKADYEKRRFAAANREMTDCDIKASTVMAIPGPLMQLCLNVGLTLVVVAGAWRVNEGLTRPGVILAFLTYFNMITMGVMGLSRIFMTLSKASASAGRIAEVLAAPDEQRVLRPGEALQPSGAGFLRFENVDFSYGKTGAGFAGGEREKALDHISFSLNRGESLGIIGPTGCGKTTIINLLMRFYDADAGGVFVDGRDVRSYDKDELHRKFGVAFQNDMVFQDTLGENIRFGRDLDEAALRRAAKDAMAAEYIDSLEDGLDHPAAIKGANLSGGQKQRLLVARALAGNPEILVLDDSSSALDYRTDAAMRRAIARSHGDSTVILIAQRVSSVMGMDHILVMDNGRCIGYGSHGELLENCPPYREIYETQMGAME